MAYDNFAYWYDRFNEAADYDELVWQLLRIFKKEGILPGHLVADLGCGTGEIALRLSAAGYDMIAVDRSENMLSVLCEKMIEAGSEGILLLRQDLAELDLFGTVRAVVSTFDTLNHLPPARLTEALQRLALFTEPGGLFVFDVNTMYKHQAVLANNLFTVETADAVCRWQNRYHPEKSATEITITVEENGRPLWQEIFWEYAYSQAHWQRLLDDNGFEMLQVLDGETFRAPCAETQRYLFVARKPKPVLEQPVLPMKNSLLLL